MFIYVGGGVGQRWQYMFTKWRLLCRARRKNCQGEFSFLSLHLWSKYTFEDLTNEQEMCSRKLEWKEMGFKVLKVTMSPRYIWMTRSRMHKTNYSKWMLYGLGKKVSCPPSTVLHFEFSKKTSPDVWFKIKCAFNISQFAGKLFEKCHMTKEIDEAFVKFPSRWDLNATTVTSYRDWTQLPNKC